jgi:hypothetical protein
VLQIGHTVLLALNSGGSGLFVGFPSFDSGKELSTLMSFAKVSLFVRVVMDLASSVYTSLSSFFLM